MGKCQCCNQEVYENKETPLLDALAKYHHTNPNGMFYDIFRKHEDDFLRNSLEGFDENKG